ncbi:uncharacterized protein L201_002254 [Kwoniella dendrophila CBS 6074]|uniref:Cytoplasmic protein n=1 Tax=Kwoniella dendrophila CBS 6074 TaxID=1295534 RepID=A0AAX4JS80_9TREE
MPSAIYVDQNDIDTPIPLVVVPPINFSLVVPGIYRSGHPNKKNFNFLKRLNLKNVIYLESLKDENEGESYRIDSLNFINENRINLFEFNLSKENNLFTLQGKQNLNDLLIIILNKQNYPILIHDDTGKNTSSLICSLIRKFQNWSLTSIFQESDLFAGPAGGSEGLGLGEAGMEFIASFDPKMFKYDKQYKPDWLD